MNIYDISIDLFAYLMAFRLRVNAGIKSTQEEVQKDLLQIFSEQEVKVRQNPALTSAYDQVRYPLVVFADEVILNSNWEYARDWETELLEQRFFESEVGGDRFFELCEDLEMSDPDVASIYYTCLSLGFRGRYEQGAEELRILKQELLEKCSTVAKDPNAMLCPQTYSVRTRRMRRLSSILRWRQIPILIIILLGITIILDRVIIWNYLTAPVRDISILAAARLATGEMPSPASLPSASSQSSQPVPHLNAPKAKITDSIIGRPIHKDAGKKALEPDFRPKVRKKIDLLSHQQEVTKEAVEKAIPEVIDRKSMPSSGYTIQVGVFVYRENAEELIQMLKGRGYEPYLVVDSLPDGKIWYRVYMGHYEIGEGNRARRAAADFAEKEHIKVFVTEYKP